MAHSTKKNIRAQPNKKLVYEIIKQSNIIIKHKEQFICTKILNRQDLILRNQKYEANSLLSLKILPTVDSEKASESITTIGLSIAKGISDSKKMNSEKKDLKFYKKGRVKT
jgi:hypothetical protein